METTAVTQLPALTETNGIEVFFYDVAQANSNQATFFDSVARYANNIIDAIASTESSSPLMQSSILTIAE